MISIRKSVNDLERAEQFRQACKSGYINAIRAAADYAIEMDPSQLAELRQNLDRIRDQLENASEIEDYESVQASFRGELRLYRDRAAEWLARMSEEMQASAAAMQSLAANLTANGSDHEATLAAGLRSLATVQESDDLGYIKQTTKDAAASISQSWEHLRRANTLVTAQLHDEIRALHREIESERRALYTDAASGAWTREKLNLRIEENLRGNEAFCLIMAHITNLKRLYASYSHGVIEAALKALVKRIHGVVGKDAVIARWADDQFVILLEVNPDYAMAVSSEISKDLSSYFSIQENGIARSLSLRVSTSVVGRPHNGDADHFREKLAMLDAVNRA